MSIFKSFYRISVFTLICAFVATSINVPLVQAGEMVVPLMPIPGTMVNLSPAFTPSLLKGMVIHPDNALKFDFIVDKGDGNLTEKQKKIEYNKLIKYFLASLAVPDKDQWVNLSPYERNRIIEDDFGKTEMGRDLLAQDYLLKQITSSLIYPEKGLGKKFWDEVYAKANKEYGNTNIPVNTFNKVWIVPDKATIYEKGNTAYVLENHLKVMLEEDYLLLNKHNTKNTTHSVASKIIREVVLPSLEKEVNEGKNFALLRQVYSGMLLAAWYKRVLKKSLLGQIYADKSKVKGIDQDPKNNEAIYEKYLQAFKKGVFNFIKEEPDAATQEVIPRKYFSGGTTSYNYDQAVTVEKEISGTDGAMLANALESADLALVVIDQPSDKLSQVPNDAAMSGDIQIQRDGFEKEHRRRFHIRSQVQAMSVFEYAHWLTDNNWNTEMAFGKPGYAVNEEDVHDQLLRRPEFRVQDIRFFRTGLLSAVEQRKAIAAVLGYDASFFERRANKNKLWMEKSYAGYKGERQEDGLRYEGFISFKNWRRDFTPEKMREFDLGLTDLLVAKNGRGTLATAAPLRVNARNISLHWDDMVFISDRKEDVRAALEVAAQVFGAQNIWTGIAPNTGKSFTQVLASEVSKHFKMGVPSFKAEDLPEVFRAPQSIDSYGFIDAGYRVSQQKRSAEIKSAWRRLSEGAYEDSQKLREMKSRILNMYPRGLTTDQDLQDALLVLLTFPADMDNNSAEEYHGKDFMETMQHWVTMYLIEHFQTELLPKLRPGEYLSAHESEQRSIILERMVLLPRLRSLIMDNDLLQRITPNSLAWLNAHMPMIVRPFGDLQEILNVQNKMGDYELYFGVIEQEGQEPLVILSNDHSDYAQPRFNMVTEGHTHGFSLAFATQSDNVRAWLSDRPSFIIGFSKRENAVHFSYYLPSERRWTSITGDTPENLKAIEQWLREFGLIKTSAGQDEAMIARQVDMSQTKDNAPIAKGGIDLNSVNLNLQIKRDGKGVPLPLAQQDMAQLNRIQGFVPRIIEIRPAAAALPLFSQLRQELKAQPAEMAGASHSGPNL